MGAGCRRLGRLLRKPIAPRYIAAFVLEVFLGFITGCATAPKSEADVFDDITQLTADFDAVHEAAFSSDMRWITFRAAIQAEPGDQLFIARVLKQDDRVIGLGPAVRITPAGSDNLGGRFSNDGVTLIFASTANKPPADSSGRPRRGGRGVLDERFELFRADAWQGAIAAVEPGKGVNLAKNPLTTNDFFDGDAVYAPGDQAILFTSTRDGAGVYVMRPDGSETVRLTTATDTLGNVTLTPDGLHFLYRRLPNAKVDRRFIADVARDPAGHIVGLAKEKPALVSPPLTAEAWYADQVHLANTGRSPVAADEEIFLVRDDGTHRLRLTFNAADDRAPIFSRDGKYLAWISTRGAARTPQLFIGKFKMPKAG